MRGRGELYHWNDDTNAWQHVGQFASQTSNAVVYPDGMFIDDIGDVHLVFACVLRNSWDTVVAIPVNISGDRAAKRDRCCRRARLLHDDERRADDGGEHFGLDPTGTGFDQGRATPLGRCRATRRRTSFTVQRRRKSTRALYGCICSRCRARTVAMQWSGGRRPTSLLRLVIAPQRLGVHCSKG